jgi:hypothetical protein
MQNFDHNIGFWEKRQFFRQKLSKIGENCDHNIDPWMTGISLHVAMASDVSAISTSTISLSKSSALKQGTYT